MSRSSGYSAARRSPGLNSDVVIAIPRATLPPSCPTPPTGAAPAAVRSVALRAAPRPPAARAAVLPAAEQGQRAEAAAGGDGGSAGGAAGGAGPERETTVGGCGGVRVSRWQRRLVEMGECRWGGGHVRNCRQRTSEHLCNGPAEFDRWTGTGWTLLWPRWHWTKAHSAYWSSAPPSSPGPPALQPASLHFYVPPVALCSPPIAAPPARQVIAQLFREQAAEHFRGTITAFQIEVLTECASIIKRLAGGWGCAGRGRTGPKGPHECWAQGHGWRLPPVGFATLDAAPAACMQGP